MRGGEDMQTFSVADSFVTVAPIIIIIAIGYVMGRMKVLGSGFVMEENRLNYYLGFPLLLFCSTLGADIKSLFDWKLVAYSMASIFVMAVAGYVIFGKIADKKQQGALTTTTFRSDILLFAVFISGKLFGSDGLALAAMMTAFISPTVTILSIVILNRLDGNAKKGPGILESMKTVVANPFVIVVIVGILYNLSGLPFPEVIEDSLSDIGSIAIPLSLLSIGVQLDFKNVVKERFLLFVGVVTRLVIVPAVFITGAALLGFKGNSIACLFAQYAAPATVSCYTFARQMNSDEKLTGNIVVFSTVFSPFTIFIGLLILANLGLI